ncbi:MAG: hypothetical protein R2684_09885 [Pyrinomonadaceae bacterium]
MYKANATLLELLIAEFSRIPTLLALLTDEIYLEGTEEISSVGVHIRHNLDFGDALIYGLENGIVDYAARRRDPFTEGSREVALKRTEELIGKLRRMRERELGSIAVRSELIEGEHLISTADREIEFVLSHTIHHYALIVERLRGKGIDLPRDFGVSHSTLRFRQATSG